MKMRIREATIHARQKTRHAVSLSLIKNTCLNDTKRYIPQWNCLSPFLLCRRRRPSATWLRQVSRHEEQTTSDCSLACRCDVVATYVEQTNSDNNYTLYERATTQRQAKQICAHAVWLIKNNSAEAIRQLVSKLNVQQQQLRMSLTSIWRELELNRNEACDRIQGRKAQRCRMSLTHYPRTCCTGT